MSSQFEAWVVVCTWVILLLLYALNRYLLKDKLTRKSPVIQLSGKFSQMEKPGSALTRTGVMFVFLANIATFVLVFAAALSPSVEQSLSPLWVRFPPRIHILGSMLFVIDYIWGFFALVYHPNYTPLTMRLPNQFLLATRGPYRIIRHPRYASEAWLNIILFVFTGIWLPLFGVIGWAAIYYQARAEEAYLMAIAGDEYARYHQKTGMFFPKLSL